MNKDYGFKIVKEGSSVNTTDIRNILSSSKYSMLKYYKDQTGLVTFTPGDTLQTADIQHNLGYVPAFIAYAKDLDGKMHYISAPPYPSGYDFYMYAYADSVKITCGFGFALSAYNKLTPNNNDNWNSFDADNSHFSVGNQLGKTFEGAYRFTSITIPQGTTINSAILSSKVDLKGSSSSDTKVKIYGIDEDNTAAFSSSPMSRTQTTAFTTENVTLPPEGQFSNHDVTTQVQEIISRANWASGNALGILIFNDTSPENAWWRDNLHGYLSITYGGNTTLTFRTIIFKNKIA